MVADVHGHDGPPLGPGKLGDLLIISSSHPEVLDVHGVVPGVLLQLAGRIAGSISQQQPHLSSA